MKFVYQSTSNNIVFHTHQGFGDLIICSPIINRLAEENTEKNFYFVSRDNSYAKNLRRFCTSKVKILALKEYPDHKNSIPEQEVFLVDSWAKYHNFSVIRSGFSGYRYDPQKPWDFSFYENAGVPYETKDTHFWVDRNFDREKEIDQKLMIESGQKYAFVHDDPSRGFSFNPQSSLKIVRNDNSIDIADMSGILENASELHMMGSSLLCLADLMNLPIQKQLAYYYTFRGELNIRGKEKWTIVNNNNKL